MKKYLSVILLLISLTFFTGFTKLEKEEEITLGPIFRAGESLSLKETIDGDVFLFGGEVSVNATISGDLIIFAGQTDINGTIGGDLRVVAGRADINSTVKDDATLAAAQLKLHKDFNIENTLTSIAKLIDFNGQALKQVNLFGEKIYLNGQVDDNATITAREVIVDQDTSIAGNLKITYQTPPNVSNQATISGDLITIKSDTDYQDSNKNYFKKLKPAKKFTLLILLQQLTTLAIEILIGSLLIALFPQLSKKLVKTSQKDPGLALGWGLLALVSTPIIATLSLVTLIGIPVGVLLFIVFGFSLYTAKLVVSLSLGTKILKDNKLSTPYKNLSLGLVVLNTLQLLPVIGWLAYAIFILNGLGSITLLEKDTLKQLRK